MFCLYPLFVGSLLLLTTVVPKGSAVIILAWLGTISCSAAFGAGYTYTKVSYSKNGQVFKNLLFLRNVHFVS